MIRFTPDSAFAVPIVSVFRVPEEKFRHPRTVRRSVPAFRFRLVDWVNFSFFIKVKLQKSGQSSARKNLEICRNGRRLIYRCEKQIPSITAASRGVQEV